MNCPSCAAPLTMSERQGIEIDYCPTCRGIWLDRGELDKIIERAAVVDYGSPQSDVHPPAEQPYAAPTTFLPQQPQPPSYRYGEHHGTRRKSFLSEIFDFD